MNRRVVITGMGAVTPVGIGVNGFWTSLKEGKCGIDKITRFDASQSRSQFSGEVLDFDPLVYQDVKAASHTDRSGQFALAAAQEAVEQSGVLGSFDPFRAAVYMGSGVGGFETTELNCRKLVEKGPRRVSPFFIPMMIANMPAGTIAIKYGCQGQATPAVTACASGTNAIGEAVRAIRHNYADVVITGGAEAPITEVGVAGFNAMKALCTADDPNAASIPFDKRRCGFVIAEGAGTRQSARRADLRRIGRLRRDVRRVSYDRAQTGRLHRSASGRSGAPRGELASRRTRLRQRARNEHVPQRRDGNQRAQTRFWRTRSAQTYD